MTEPRKSPLDLTRNWTGSLADAILIAATFHSNQFDKGGNPYILHPMKVMHYTRSEDTEVMIIAVLHDVVEDTDVTLEDLRMAGFSWRVIEGVDGVTKRDGETKEESLQRVMRNHDSVIVKMADLRHNSDIRRLKGITEKDFKRMEWYQTAYSRLREYRAMMGF